MRRESLGPLIQSSWACPKEWRVVYAAQSKGKAKMTHGALPFSRTLGLNLRSGAEDDPVSGSRLHGALTFVRTLGLDLRRQLLAWPKKLFEEPLTYSSEMKKKELKRFKHQSQKLDMTQAKSISKKHPQRRK
ncbi:hypothetical protein BY996DRAFT_6523117 [Phakopsora pachyrhizi]|nr:hypothetical protein BY996DRAFT_6523117 [Phakopsora pachyrhizi]